MTTVRHRWMDVLRGAAILLVMHSHVVDSVYAKFPDASPLLASITSPMAPFRMPVLVFLSGLLVSRSIGKGLVHYVHGKVRNIVYPFVIWTFVMFGLYAAREALLGKSSPVGLIQALTVEPIHHLWFLYYLFWFYILAAATHIVRPAIATAVYSALMIALIASGYQRFPCLLAFFIIGAYCGSALARRLVPTVQDWRLLTACTVGALALLHIYSYTIPSYSTSYAIVGLLIIPLIIRIAMALEDTRAAALFEFLGRNSIVIYLAHVPIAMTLPVLMVRLYKGDPNYVYPLLMITVLTVSMALAKGRDRFWLVARLFAPPPKMSASVRVPKPQA